MIFARARIARGGTRQIFGQVQLITRRFTGIESQAARQMWRVQLKTLLPRRGFIMPDAQLTPARGVMVDDRVRGCRSFSNYKGSIGGTDDTVRDTQIVCYIAVYRMFYRASHRSGRFQNYIIVTREALLIIIGG